MSDYSKTTNFTAKDALPTGNPSKTILGSEHDTEYTNIQTAIATKANKTGAPATTNNLAMLTATGDLADSLVETDGSGNISSNGTITGTTITASTGFTGDLTGDVTGNADTATTATTATNQSGGTVNCTTATISAAYTATGTGTYRLQPVDSGFKLQTTNTMTKVVEFLAPSGGTIYFQWQHYTTNATYAANSRAYINGAAQGSLKSTNSTSAVTVGELITFSAGDLIQIYASNDHNSVTQTFVTNFSFWVNSTTLAAPSMMRHVTF